MTRSSKLHGDKSISFSFCDTSNFKRLKNGTALIIESITGTNKQLTEVLKYSYILPYIPFLIVMS